MNRHEPSAYPVRFTPVIRSDGITSAERYLQRLCEGTFLRLWSYPGVYRDQGGGKELADLLVVFGDDIVVFSDKSCAFPNTGDLKVDWRRWHRKAIIGAAEQAWGAERWIRRYPDRLFLDVNCTRPFPIALPPVSRARFRRVVVAHNVAEPCRKHFGGGSGSLMYSVGIGGGGDLPFVIGDLNPSKGFVHVLDDAALDIVLKTLDTVSDFIAYLRAKEEFVRSGGLGLYAGEEELLAAYLTTGTKNAHQFPVSAAGATLFIDQGHWERFHSSPQRRAQLAANAISYSWDHLIAKFERHALDGTSEFRSHDDVRDFEPVLRELAAEDRTQRRGLSQALIGLLQAPGTTDAPINVRVVKPTRDGGPAYVLLALSEGVAASAEEYRRHRRELARWYALVTRHLFPDFRKVVVIARQPITQSAAICSEDVSLLQEEHWTPEAEAEARRLHEELGLLKNVRGSQLRVPEYPLAFARDGHGGSPQARQRAIAGRDRNRPCSCGSGTKAKRCCAR
jgi:hypothetical protein